MRNSLYHSSFHTVLSEFRSLLNVLLLPTISLVIIALLQSNGMLHLIHLDLSICRSKLEVFGT
jgi:hypothetical protein